MAKALMMSRTVAEQLECPVCMDQFKLPKLLSCMHTFCQDCLKSLIKKKKQTSVIVCPQCRQKTLVSDVSSLHTNFIAQNVIEALITSQKETNKNVNDEKKENTNSCFDSNTKFQFDGIANKNINVLSHHTGFVLSKIPDWHITKKDSSQNNAVREDNNLHHSTEIDSVVVTSNIFSSVVSTSTPSSPSASQSAGSNVTFNRIIPVDFNFCVNAIPTFSLPSSEDSETVFDDLSDESLVQDTRNVMQNRVNKSSLFTIGWNKNNPKRDISMETVCKSLKNLSISADTNNDIETSINSSEHGCNTQNKQEYGMVQKEHIKTASSTLDVPSWGSIDLTSFAP